MDAILEGFYQAFRLIVTLDPYLISVIKVQAVVSGTAVLMSSAVGLPLGVLVALNRFPGKGFLNTLVSTGMGLPPVVVGVFVYLLLSRSGPLGFLHLLNTPSAMIIAQFILATPIIMGITIAVVEAVPKEILELGYTLGGSGRDVAMVAVRESFYGLVTAVLAGFGRAVAEVGAIFIVGGGIVHPVLTGEGATVQESVTRTLTVAAVVETRQGLYGNAIAYGMILVGLAFILNFTAAWVKGRYPHGQTIV
ncbi:MAG: ABC transporter permease subunit [Euryarchaeota archaeon]|nr:ABC transporter permease subunit [Euryarchaeota archaeon]